MSPAASTANGERALDPALAALSARIAAANDARCALFLCGGGSKHFYGEAVDAEPLALDGYRGVVDYEPTELVVTARCGTPLAELETLLAERRQMLGFEPPHFGASATVGGCVAAGLAGPRRPSAGGVRDFVLGVKTFDARGRLLTFGGQVMKNVAGYDLSRLYTGSLGILGPIVEVSLKVLPVPACERTQRLELTQAQALERFNQWAGQPMPVSATTWVDGVAHVRLSGAQPAVLAAAQAIGGETLEPESARAFWVQLREQGSAFFAGGTPLWRVSVPSTAPALSLSAPALVEWGGALRWLRWDGGAEGVRSAATALGGHATLFRGHLAGVRAFQAPSEAVMRLHRALKRELDPHEIFNPGRMFADL